MRTVAALLLLTVAGCSVPSYSLRSSSATPLCASADQVPVPELDGSPRTDQSPRTIVLVPAVRHGHSAMWKTGAIITFASLGVTLAGAALTIGGLQGVNIDAGGGGDWGLFWTGIAVSIIGDGGAFIAGPITWMAGINGPSDR